MLKNLLLLILAHLSIFSIAQSFDYDVSSPYRVYDAAEKEYERFDDHVVSIKISGREALIQRFSIDGMAEVSRKEYDDFDKDFQFEMIRRIGDHFYLFYSIVCCLCCG